MFNNLIPLGLLEIIYIIIDSAKHIIKHYILQKNDYHPKNWVNGFIQVHIIFYGYSIWSPHSVSDG